MEGRLEAVSAGAGNSEALKRYFQENWDHVSSVKEDELIEIGYYWQAGSRGLGDAFAVVIGEQRFLVRYGKIPFSYKGIPFRGKSYDPHEWQLDGTGLLEIDRGIQEVTNTLFNLRLDDVRQNMMAPYITTGRFVDQTTLDDAAARRRLWRASEESYEASQNDPNFDLSKHFFRLQLEAATDGIFQDLAFILGQGKENTNVQDVFQGQMPQKQATLGEVREVLERNMGVFKPIWTQMMRAIEEIAEIAFEYYKDPLFFGENRIISIVGQNRYAETVKGWAQVGDMTVREVSADEMDVDATIVAVSAADAFMARTLRVSTINEFMASTGQNPGVWDEIKDHYEWAEIFGEVFQQGGFDLERTKRTPEKVQQIQKSRQDAQQAAQKEALSTQLQLLQAKEQAAAAGEAQVAQVKSQAEMQREHGRIKAEAETDLRQILTQTRVELAADLQKIETELELKRRNAMEQMLLEFRLEMAAQMQGLKVSIGVGGNQINKA